MTTRGTRNLARRLLLRCRLGLLFHETVATTFAGRTFLVGHTPAYPLAICQRHPDCHPSARTKRSLFTTPRSCANVASAQAEVAEEGPRELPIRERSQGSAEVGGNLEPWTSLGVDGRLARTLVASGLTEPFEAQKEMIPLANRGGNVICTAETGSGKTLAFLLPVFSQILRLRELGADQEDTSGARSPLGVILVHSREMVQQVYLVATTLSNQFVAQARADGRDEKPFHIVAEREQSAMLSPKCPPLDLLIATPESLYPKRKLSCGEFHTLARMFARTRYVVFDEADILVNTPLAAGRRLLMHLKRHRVPFVAGEFDGTRPRDSVAPNGYELADFDADPIGDVLQHRLFLFTCATLPDLRSRWYTAYAWLQGTFDKDLIFLSTRNAHRVSRNVKEEFIVIRLENGKAVCGALQGEMSTNCEEISGPEMAEIDDMKWHQVKSKLLSLLLAPQSTPANEQSQMVLIFTSSKSRAESLHASLTEDLAKAVAEAGGASREWDCAVMTGNMSLQRKTDLMARFIAGGPGPEGRPCVRIMIATANMSRGVDFPNVALVIHVDFPDNAADYLHKCGRTGRARNTGEVLSLVAPYDLTLANLVYAASRGVQGVTPTTIRNFPELPDAQSNSVQKESLSGIFSRRQQFGNAIKNSYKREASLESDMSSE